MSPSATVLPEIPSVRSPREWGVAAAQSLVSLGAGLVIFLVVLGSMLEEFADQPPQGLLLLSGIDALIGIPLTLAIGPLRFLRPGRVWTVLHLFIAALGGCSSWSLPAAGIALYRLGIRRRLGLDAMALVLLTLAVVGWAASEVHFRREALSMVHVSVLGVMLISAAVPLLMGRVVGTRYALIASLRERAEAADRERETAQREAAAVLQGRDAEVARVRAEERAALARDMHDSVSHHLSAIAMHAGAMAYREDMPPQTLRATALTVRDAAQEANRELREVLVALRSSTDATPLATVPTLWETVERARASGQQVELVHEGESEAELEKLGRGTVVALTRILSEALTNAAKHAPGAPVRAVLSRQNGNVLLTVTNPLTAPGADGAGNVPGAATTSTGHGLIGVEERARLLGGGARWTRSEDTFEMEAWMPW